MAAGARRWQCHLARHTLVGMRLGDAGLELHLAKKSAGAAVSITSAFANGVALSFPNSPGSSCGDVCAWTGQETCV